MTPPTLDTLPYDSSEIRVGTHRLRYLDEGPADAESAPVLLCVHGNPTWSFYWRRLVERFRDRYRVVAPDHLGCGRSDKPPRRAFEYSLASHRDNLVRLIDQLDLRRVTLVAHDWGGAIGLAAMIERVQRLERIVLLNTGAFPPPYVPARIALCRLPVIGTAAIRGLNLFARAAVYMATARRRLAPDVASGLLAPYDNWDHRVAIDAFVRDIPMSSRHPTYHVLADLEAALPSLADHPSLLIWGMRDWCFRPECLRRFQAVWRNSETVEINDAGHYVMEDAPAEVIAAVDPFLARPHPDDV